MICEKFVTAAIILRDDRVLLARRSSGQKLAGFWEFPGGKVEAGETPESCLARELEEELGIGVHVGRKFAESLHQYRSREFSYRCISRGLDRRGAPRACTRSRGMGEDWRHWCLSTPPRGCPNSCTASRFGGLSLR